MWVAIAVLKLNELMDSCTKKSGIQCQLKQEEEYGC